MMQLDLRGQRAVWPKQISGREAANMKMEKQISTDNKIDEATIDMLFSKVFPHLSDLVIFSLGHFSECGRTNGDGQFQTYGDGQFHEALGLEAFRRRLVTSPRFSVKDVDLEKFSQQDLDQATYWFDDGDDTVTLEDYYAEHFLSHDRYGERNKRDEDSDLEE
jgi:hypothetical protein